jgi:hypothetical protein
MSHRSSLFGRLLTTLGVLLLAIKIGLEMTDTAGGGSSLLMFAAIAFILLGVAILFRHSTSQDE